MVSRKGFCQAVDDMLASLPRSARGVYRGNEDCVIVKPMMPALNRATYAPFDARCG